MSELFRKKLLTLSAIAILSLIAVSCSDGETPFATVGPTATSSGQGQPTPTSDAPAGGDAVNGEALFASNGCSACHSTGSDAVVGPGLSGIGERGDAYLFESIKSPSATVAEGFDPLMPSFPALSDEEINDLVAYLKTLP